MDDVYIAFLNNWPSPYDFWGKHKDPDSEEMFWLHKLTGEKMFTEPDETHSSIQYLAGEDLYKYMGESSICRDGHVSLKHDVRLKQDNLRLSFQELLQPNEFVPDQFYDDDSVASWSNEDAEVQVAEGLVMGVVRNPISHQPGYAEGSIDIVPHVRSTIESLFEEYDLDCSGTIDSDADEMLQLTINVIQSISLSAATQSSYHSDAVSF